MSRLFEQYNPKSKKGGKKNSNLRQCNGNPKLENRYQHRR